MAGPDNLTPFKKGDKRASEAGKIGGKAKSVKTIIKDILDSKLPEKIYDEIKDKYGLEENLPQGEIAVRAIAINMIKSGDVKTMSELLKITGEYKEELDLTQKIVYLDKQDKDL